jgi:hypothetical protein
MVDEPKSAQEVWKDPVSSIHMKKWHQGVKKLPSSVKMNTRKVSLQWLEFLIRFLWLVGLSLLHLRMLVPLGLPGAIEIRLDTSSQGVGRETRWPASKENILEEMVAKSSDIDFLRSDKTSSD